MTIDFNAHVEGNCLNFKNNGTILSEILSSDDNLNEFSSFIKAKPNITALNLDNCNIDIEKIKSLIKSINNSNITYLDIGYNEITDIGATAIATMPNLTYLYIHYNKITDEGATAIATMPNLIHLDIGYNNITDEGVIAIANKLSKLINLGINGNNITDKGTTAIANKLSKLIHLDITNNNITDEGVIAIVNKLSNLIRLNIFNITTAEGITAIAKALQDNTILINLGTWIKNADITKILERLGFAEENINEFNSKIGEIIDEVKEMFLLELDILISNMIETGEIYVQADTLDLTNLPKFLYYRETTDELRNNQQLTDLYEKHPELKIPGTILHNLLKSGSPIYPNIAVLLNQHVDENTFKHNPLIQEGLNKFSTPVLTKNLSSALEDNNIEDIVLWLSVINLTVAVKLEPDLLAKLSQIQNDKVVEILLVNQPLKLLIDNEGNNLLHLSLQNGNYQLATRILKEGCINVEQQNNKGKTALDILHESPLALEQKEVLDAPLAQHPDTHLSNTNEHTQSDLAIEDPMALVLGDISHHTTDTGCIS